MPPDSDSPQQRTVENVQVGGDFTIGGIDQRIDQSQTNIYQQRSKPLSITIDSALPPIAHWQARAEEGKIAGYFANAQVRLVGISAAGGYGKSALAAQLYKQAIGFDKKLWANFQEPVNFGTFGRWLISQLLGEKRYDELRETYERDTDAELIIKALNLLAEQRHLLILDNLETLFQSTELWQPYGEFLAKWLGRGGGGVMLLTSQIELELPTAAWKWETIAGLAVDQGVALLQAQQIEGELADLRSFVELADGHPLLLQLTASWLRREQAANYEPATIYRLKQNDVTLLREIRERHRDVETSVGDLLDRAFDRLHPPHLQVLLLRLSVLRQRFGLAAAQAMIEESIDLPDLRKLVRSSFLQEKKQGEDWWFDFLPLIQRYLREKAAQELSIAHEKAIDFFWNHRQPWTGALEDCRPQLEAFHHHCELGHYANADQAMATCVGLLDRAGYYSSLVPVHERLTQEWQTSDDAEIQNLGWAWTQLGNTYRTLGRVQAAIAAHQQAQQNFQSIAYRQGEAAALGNLGLAYYSLGQYPEAIDLHQQHLTIAREIGDRHGEANSLGNLGIAYQSLGQYPEAIDFLQQTLTIAREIGDRQGEANSLGSLGIAYQSLGQYPEAIDFLQQTLTIAREIGDRQGEANSLGNLGTAYHSLGQYPEAIDLHQQSLAIKREIGNRQGEAISLGNLGTAYHSLGQYPEAIDFHQQSLAIKREIGDRQGEANSLGNLGNAYHSLGQYPEAIDFHQQSLAIEREIGNRQGEANSLGSLGIAYNSLGQYQQALDFLQQSLAIQREIGNRQGEANALDNLGLPYCSLGQYTQAIDFHQQSLAIQRELGDRQGEASSLDNIGSTYHALGHYQQALDFHQQSLAIDRGIGNRHGEADSLNNLGLAYRSLGQHQEALEKFQQAKQLFGAMELDHRVEWCDTVINTINQSIAAKSRPQKRVPLWVYFLIGLAIVLLIAWLL